MTDDPRLDAAARAWEAAAKVARQEDFDQATYEAGLILAVIDADRAFRGDRKEVMRHQPVPRHNATAPTPVVGADPPWLDEAADAARRHTGAPLMPWTDIDESSRGYWRNVARAVLRVANAQPVSDAEIKAACDAFDNAPITNTDDVHRSFYTDAIRAALEAAAKVRAGG